MLVTELGGQDTCWSQFRAQEARTRGGNVSTLYGYRTKTSNRAKTRPRAQHWPGAGAGRR